jgi:hypothetical protein
MPALSVSSSDHDQKASRSTQRESAPWAGENDEIRAEQSETDSQRLPRRGEQSESMTNDETSRARARGRLWVLDRSLVIRASIFIRHSEFAIRHFQLLPHLFW